LFCLRLSQNAAVAPKDHCSQGHHSRGVFSHGKRPFWRRHPQSQANEKKKKKKKQEVSKQTIIIVNYEYTTTTFHVNDEIIFFLGCDTK